jgi:hypothetical protein
MKATNGLSIKLLLIDGESFESALTTGIADRNSVPSEKCSPVPGSKPGDSLATLLLRSAVGGLDRFVDAPFTFTLKSGDDCSATFRSGGRIPVRFTT